jgi:aldehyde dehydrogenase (NAD+)
VQFSAGAYYAPTIIDSITNNSTICQQEIFGPVLCVLPFSDERDLITQANDTVYGLACGIWTRDFQRAWRVARTIQAGNIWINTYRQNSIATPFGGYKQSGLGRERGPQGLRQYQHVKAIYIATEAKPLSLLR